MRGLLRDEIRSILTRPAGVVPFATRPWVVFVVGVNGVGKTTTIGKLAASWKKEGRTTLVCAADTFRAGAAQQLETWARRTGAPFHRGAEGADPSSVLTDALRIARSKGYDAVLVDTAGRLHTKGNLMAELAKMARVAGREVPGAPHETLLVLDATLGSNALNQGREFAKAGGVTGLVVTKLDGTAKGGVAVAIAHGLKLPVRYVGVGEGIDDLVPFSADEYVDGLFEEKW
jgi:fused signal recognition particle receptor